jgi:hypothetical protein
MAALMLTERTKLVDERMNNLFGLPCPDPHRERSTTRRGGAPPSQAPKHAPGSCGA